jgi:MFS family permease
LGIFAAGWLGDRAFRRGVSGRLHVAWIALAAATPCLLLALDAPAGQLVRCALWLLPACMLLYAYYGAVYATIQDIVAPAFRGTAMALYFCAMYLLGAVLGPVATGWTSDYFARRAAAADGVSASIIASATGQAGGLQNLWQAGWVAETMIKPGVSVVTEAHKALGVHDAMYLIPVLNVALVLVLFVASCTVKGDYLRCRERLATAGKDR